MIACVRVPNFALRLHVLGHPSADGESMVLAAPDGERRTVLDLTPEAAARYLWPGMSIRDVQAMSPDTIVVAADPAHEAIVSEGILRDLEALSPLVEPDSREAGCWYLDLAGLERLFGGPSAIADRILERMPPLLRPRIGLAKTKFGAYVAAGRAAAGGVEHAPTDLAGYLTTAPIASLPAEPRHLQTLRQLGIDTLGALADLRASAVAARFGAEGRKWWDLARGIDRSMIKARLPQEIISEHMDFEVATASRDAVLTALRLLIQRASSPSRLRHRVAQHVMIRLVYEREGSWERRFALRNPASGDELARQLRLRLDDVMVAGAVISIDLELTGLGAEAPRQAHLAAMRGRDERPIVEADEHLKNRYSRSSLHRIVPVEPWSRIPERRFALIPLAPGPDDTPIALNTPHLIQIEPDRSQRPIEPGIVTLEQQRRSVERVAARWFLNDEWWLRPIKRRYFTLELAGGAQQTVYHDLTDQHWYAQDVRANWP